MEYMNRDQTYLIFKGALGTIGILILMLMSNFWIGTKESWDHNMAHEFVLALIVRTVFLIVIGLLFLGLSFLLNRMYKKSYNFSRELTVLAIISLLLNLKVMLIS